MTTMPKTISFGWFAMVLTLLILQTLYISYNSLPSFATIKAPKQRSFVNHYDQKEEITKEKPKEVTKEKPPSAKKVDSGEVPQKLLNYMKEMEIGQKLKKKIKILCWINTDPHLINDTIRVEETWGKRCDKLLFMSSEEDKVRGAIGLGPETRGYSKLFLKTRAAMKYVYERYLHKYNWFYKGDDDTFVVMENLRYMLSPYDTNFPVYFGQRVLRLRNKDYNTGGGFVMSRGALKAFVEKAMNTTERTICPQDHHGEDTPIGHCMRKVGVMIGDSRDHMGLWRFYHQNDIKFMNEKRRRILYYKVGMDKWCSPTSVAFLNSPDLYATEFYIYGMRPFGYIMDPIQYPAMLPPDKNATAQLVKKGQDPGL